MPEHFDLYPLFDADLDTSYLDVFQPLPLAPYQHASINRSSKKTSLTSVPETALAGGFTKKNVASKTVLSTATVTAAATPANNLYCKECKKKFNNEATMQNHLKSAKHLAAVKKATGSKKPAKKDTPITTLDHQHEFINPETTASLRKMEDAAKLTPQQAISVYYELSQEFYQQRRPLYTAKVLSALISLHQDTELHWKAHLIMARLDSLYNECMDSAYDHYFTVLEQLCHIKRTDILSLAELCSNVNAIILFEKCSRLAANSKLTLSSTLVVPLLEESASAFAQRDTTVMGSQNLAEKVSIVLYGLAYAATEQRSYCPMISKIYDTIGMTHCSLDVQLLYGDHLLASSANAEAAFIFFSILLIALEQGDFVRANRIYQRILSSNGIINYPELKLLSKISVARCNLDFLSLAHELKRELDHIELLLMSKDSHLLLFTLDHHQQSLDYLDRLRLLLSI